MEIIELQFKPSRQFLIKLLQNILVYLLCERAQIPFNFDHFERFLEKTQKEDNECYKKMKQLKIAKDTYEKIVALKQVIKDAAALLTSVCQ
jgi:hypothetical protein